MKKSRRAAQLQLQLWKTVAGVLSMKRVVEHCDYLLQHQPDPATIVYHSVMTAICVEYGRPFAAGSRSAIGALSSKFESFSDSYFRQMHRSLLNARHNFYAHFSESIQDVIIEFVPYTLNGEPHVTIRTGRKDLFIAPKSVPEIRELAVEQRQRLTKEKEKLLTTLCRSGIPSAGFYKLSATGRIGLHRMKSPPHEGWMSFQGQTE